MSEPTMKWYTPSKVAEMFGVTTDTVYAWINDGLLAATKQRKRFRIAHDDVIEFGKKKFQVPTE